MRLKVLFALVVLLLALVVNAILTTISSDRTRQGLVANEAYLELQGSVDAAWKSLNDFAPALGRGTTARLDPNLPLALRMGRKHLDDALGVIDRYLEKEPRSSRRADFENRRQQVAALGTQLDGVASELGTAAAAVDPKARPEFESHFATLTHNLNRMRRPLRGESAQIAQRLSDDGETALWMAIALGVGGLLVAGAVLLFTLASLRPLSVLRAHARQLGKGNYAQRTGVTSNDEIGDLARDFDAMADAIQEREQRLIRSERLATVGRMAAHIAHEVRNPLASIGLNAELLGDEIADRGDEARRLVTSIIGEVDRLTEITETYLRFARLPRPKLEPEDIGAIVASVVDMSRGELAQDGVTVNVDIAPGLPDVGADEGQLRQALLNLIRNAREAMSGAAERRLDVAVREAAGRIVIAIHDTGPGIGAANMAKIFDPFFSTKERGTGLGLALVQHIVVDHGGQIEVASPSGAGTTFTLTLPSGDGDRQTSVGAAAGSGAVSGRPLAVAERVVKSGELEVQQGRGLRAEEERALEGGGPGGSLAGGS